MQPINNVCFSLFFIILLTSYSTIDGAGSHLLHSTNPSLKAAYGSGRMRGNCWHKLLEKEASSDAVVEFQIHFVANPILTKGSSLLSSL